MRLSIACSQYRQRPDRRPLEYRAGDHQGPRCRRADRHCRDRVRQFVHCAAQRDAIAASPSLPMTSTVSSRAASWSRVRVVFILAVALPAEQQRSDRSLSPQELARIWDAEHVSLPLAPVLDHKEVANSSRGAGSRFGRPVPDGQGWRIGRRPRDLSRSRRHRPVQRVDLVTDARRRADRHVGAVRCVRVSTTPSPRGAVARILSTLTLHVIPMLNPDGARAVPTAQRAEHRCQP